jgi:hypothetical protein
VKSRYNVSLWHLQSDIGSSNIRLSPIPFITDIGISAHLWRRHPKVWGKNIEFVNKKRL